MKTWILSLKHIINFSNRFPFEVETSFLREDSIQDVMRREDILKNAKHIKNQQIQIPKVVE